MTPATPKRQHAPRNPVATPAGDSRANEVLVVAGAGFGRPAPFTVAVGPRESRTGRLTVTLGPDGTDDGSCLTLRTSAGNYVLYPATGHPWVVSSGTRRTDDGRSVVVPHDSGLRSLVGDRAGPFVYHLRQVTILGQPLVASRRLFPHECYGVDGIFSIEDVTPG